MRPKISNKNINYYLAQTYGYSSMNSFFKESEHHPKHRAEVLKRIVSTFTGYHLDNGKLWSYNPYTSKSESLKISNFNHIGSKEDLLKELSMLHKARTQMLVQSRKRILKLSKKKTLKRDYDLTATISKVNNKRLQQLQKSKTIPDREQELE